MNGIFVAYHNVKRVFGFQYIPIHEMDRALHGQRDTCLGDQEFKASLTMFNEVLNKATAKFPEQSLRIHFETRPADVGGMPAALHVFAEPMEEDAIDSIQNSQAGKIAAWEREIMGKNNPNGSESNVDHDSAATGSEIGSIVDADASNSDASAKYVDSVEHGNGDRSSSDKNGTEATASNDSNADVDFLDTVAAADDEDLKPLFHATLIVQSRVNGRVPDGERPTDLKDSDKWEIDYILKEYETTRSQWAQYEDTKSRRKFALSEKVEEADDAEEQKDDYFIRFLKSMSVKGKEIRGKIDELYAGQQVVRVDDILPKEREKIEGVEDYMAWLYDKAA